MRELDKKAGSRGSRGCSVPTAGAHICPFTLWERGGPTLTGCRLPLPGRRLSPPTLNSSNFAFLFVFSFFLSATNVENELNCAMLLFWGWGTSASRLPTLREEGAGAVSEAGEAPKGRALLAVLTCLSSSRSCRGRGRRSLGREA